MEAGQIALLVSNTARITITQVISMCHHLLDYDQKAAQSLETRDCVLFTAEPSGLNIVLWHIVDA